MVEPGQLAPGGLGGWADQARLHLLAFSYFTIVLIVPVKSATGWEPDS